MKKRYWIPTLALLFSLASISNAQIISLGVGGAYAQDAEETGVNVNVIFHALPILDIKGGYNYFFVDTENGSYSSFDLDAHYVLLDVSLSRVYLLGGLNFTTIKFDDFLGTDLSGTNTGANLGAGGEVGLGSLIRLFGELKYVTANSSGLVFTAGLRIGF